MTRDEIAEEVKALIDGTARLTDFAPSARTNADAR
jgi:hypothetical protein